MKTSINSILDKYTEGNYLFSDEDKTFMIRDLSTLYLLVSSSDDYDAEWEEILFGTYNLETATNYILKYNNVLNKLKSFYKEKFLKGGNLDFTKKWYEVKTLQPLKIKTIEIR